MEAERKEGLAGRAGSGVLPCPFCGGPSGVVESAGLFRAGCESCAIWTDSWTDSEGARAAWNERSEWDHVMIGLDMRLQRKQAGISGRQMADRLKLSPAYVSDLELGRRCWTPEKLRWYRDALSPNAERSATAGASGAEETKQR